MEATRRGMIGMAGAAAAAAALSSGGAFAQGAAHRLGSSSKTLYWVATVTPCNASGEIDFGALQAIMQFHKQAGADGIVVLGTSGEFPSYSVAERKRVAEVAMQNKNGMNMIMNPGTPNIAETVDLAKHAESIGYDGMLVIPPFYFNNPGVNGLTRYYSMLFDNVGLPINLYHIPGTSEVPITLDLLKNLYHYPHLAGIKDSSGSKQGYLDFVTAFPELNMRTGTSSNLEPALEHGMGAILADGNSFSAQCAAIFRAFHANGNWKAELAKLRAKQMAMRSAIQATGFESSLPFTMSVQMGGPAFFGRAPLRQPDADAQAAIRAAYAKAKDA